MPQANQPEGSSSGSFSKSIAAASSLVSRRSGLGLNFVSALR